MQFKEVDQASASQIYFHDFGAVVHTYALYVPHLIQYTDDAL